MIQQNSLNDSIRSESMQSMQSVDLDNDNDKSLNENS